MSIKKVAKLAGVSTSTVSRVINKHPRVAQSTEKAVRSAMEKLDYTPSARRPGPKPASMSNIKTIGFFVLGKSEDNATPGFFDLLRGVSNAVSKTPHKLEFSAVADPSIPPKPLSRASIDAVVLHGIPPQGRFKELLENLPTVWVMGNRQRPEKADQVMPDTLAVGEIAARYLSDLGHERLAFLNLDAGHWGLASYGHCFVGVAENLGKPVVKLQRTRGDVPGYRSGFDPEIVENIVDEFMKLSPRPTGLFIGDAMMVAIFQPILLERGIRFGPGQTQVITCNNEEAFLAGLNPRPAVIDIGIEEIGRQGVEQLLWLMDNKSRSARVTSMIQPTLVKPGS